MVDKHDVFLSYHSADQNVVEEIAKRLQGARLRPFFDYWELVPGESSIPALERALACSATVAVFCGPRGMGPWQEEERQVAVRQAVRGGKRVIPVLLPGAREGDIPEFLRHRGHVEFEREDGFSRLIAGVKGVAPGRGEGRPRPFPTGDFKSKRWWLVPDDVVADLGSSKLSFESDDGALWTFSLSSGPKIHWDHQAGGFVGKCLEGVGQEDSAFLSRLLPAMIGNPPCWTLDGPAKRIVDAIAKATVSASWVSGRRLRSELKMERERFLSALSKLHPRYVCTSEGDRGDGYRLTIPGFWYSSRAHQVERVLAAVLAALKRSFEADPDVREYSLDEIVRAGQLEDDCRGLAVALVSLAGLTHGGTVTSGPSRPLAGKWGVPREIEDIVRLGSVRDLFRFFQRFPSGDDRRCWPTAPIRPMASLGAL